MDAVDGILIFPCRCGKRLRVGTDFAGQAVQCPACSLLLTVPEPEDKLLDDGTFRLDEIDEELGRSSRRYAISDSDRVSDRDGPPTLSYASQHTPAAPAYTPVQLSHAGIINSGIANERPREIIPYEAWNYDPAKRSLTLLPYDLLLPANVIVVLIVFGATVVAELMAFLAIGGAIPLAAVTLILCGLTFAHYVNVVDETGPEGRDEMPPMLRDLSVYDDLLKPLGLGFFALLISFGPAVAILALNDWQPTGSGGAIGIVLALIGLLIYPAVQLTLVAGGTFLNLAPWRVIRVMAVGGSRYLMLTCVLLPATLVIHLIAVVCTTEWITGYFGWPTVSAAMGVTSPSKWVLLVVGNTALLFGAYAAHLTAWWLGRLYQRGHAHYGWLLQRHERSEERNPDPAVIQAKERAALARSRELEAFAKRGSAQTRNRIAG